MGKDKEIAFQTFNDLINIFKDKNWIIPSVDNMYKVETLLGRFCERLSILDKSEQELMIDLTRRFTLINIGDYMAELGNLFEKIYKYGDEAFVKSEKVYFLPLITKQDVENNKTKSSSAVWYLNKTTDMRYNYALKEKKVVHCDPNKFNWIKKIKENEVIVLLDDYIGTGETAVSAAKWIIDEYNIDSKQIFILSIAAQKNGLEYINSNLGVKAYSNKIFERGISDYYSDEKLESNTKIMKKIENKLKVKDEMKFGYKGSEALISLNVIPNNTFPVFWHQVSMSKNPPFIRQ